MATPPVAPWPRNAWPRDVYMYTYTYFYLHIQSHPGEPGWGRAFTEGSILTGWLVCVADAVAALRLLPALEAAAAVFHRCRRHAGRFGLRPASGLGGRISKPVGVSWARASAVSAVDVF